MSYISAPINLHEVLFKLKLNGYVPVLAHPERYRFLFRDLDIYYKLKKIGCKFQLNLLSTTGFYGKDITIMSEKLLNRGLIDFVGSDIHSINHINFFNNHVKLKNTKEINKAIQQTINFFS